VLLKPRTIGDASDRRNAERGTEALAPRSQGHP
jgi:hypothetical protein